MVSGNFIQVVIGGKNKYIINGRTVQQGDVQNVFHSVQLNVNNPHFLIMQGRITKVLNMKPPEILSMIEEAAGTRMFEAKKETALKTIEKKQQKVEELTRIMEQDIQPTLTQLRGDRENYQRYMSNGHELERVDRFLIAHEYDSLQKDVANDEARKEEMRSRIQELDRLRKEKKEEQNNLQIRLNDLQTEMSKELEGQLADMKLRSDELSKDLVKSDTQLRNQSEEQAQERTLSASLSEQIANASEARAEKHKELEVVTSELEIKEKELTAAEESVRQHRERYQNACAGIADESNAGLLSIPEQIGNWERKAREAESMIQQNAIRLEHARKSAKEKLKFSRVEEDEHKRNTEQLEVLQRNVTDAETAFSAASAEVKNEDHIRRDIVGCKQRCLTLKDAVDGLTAQLEARLRFEFKDPVRGFDRTKVRGMVAKLVKVRDMRDATALEVVAGGKLYQVVVDTEQTGKQLLDHGQLKKRVTILPLNRLNGKCVDEARVSLSKEVAARLGGTAHLAIELVGFEDELVKAMEYVFGGAIVCDSSKVAKSIAFDRNIGTKTVTLEGDVYDPSGTLTGGSASQIGTILKKLQELDEAEVALREATDNLKSLEHLLKLAEQAAGVAKTASNKLQDLRAALGQCQDKLSQSKYTRALEEQQEAEKTILTLENETSELRILLEKANHELRQLATTATNASSKRDAVMKVMESAMKDAQRVSSQLKSQLSTIKHRKDVIALELEALSTEIAALNEQKTSSDMTLEKLSSEVCALESMVAKKKVEFDDVRAAIEARQKELSKCNKEVKRLEQEREAASRAEEEAASDHRRISINMVEWDRRVRETQIKLKAMVEKWAWIESECEFFGQAGSEYDFAARDIRALSEKRGELQRDQVCAVNSLPRLIIPFRIIYLEKLIER